MEDYARFLERKAIIDVPSGIEEAKRLNIPVYFTLQDLIDAEV